MKTFKTFSLILYGLSLIVLSCYSLAATVPEGVELSDNQSLTRNIRGYPETLDPHLAKGIPADHITRELFEGLVTEDAEGQIIPAQAESWTTSDDGMLWNFRIQEGLKWSDGSPLTAEDFEYSFKRLASSGTSYSIYLKSIGIKNAISVLSGAAGGDVLGVKATDKFNLEIELIIPSPQLLSKLTHRSMYPVPKHVIEKHGKKWTDTENIVVNGPFTLTEQVKDERIVVTPNPEYRDSDKLVTDKVTFLPLESEEQALRQYLDGKIDILASLPWAHYHESSVSLEDQVVTVDSLSTYYLTFNTQKQPFDDVRVRQALSFVINREKIAQDIAGQNQRPAYTFTPDIISHYKVPVPDYQLMSPEERLVKARELLSEAGYSDRAPLDFTYMYNKSDINKSIAEEIRDMWQKNLPVQVTLEEADWSHYLECRTSGHYQVARALWGGDYDEAMTMLDIHQSSHKLNSSFYNNPGYDALLDQANREKDIWIRNKLFATAELFLINDMPVAPIYWNNNTYAIKPKLRGVSYLNPLGRIYSREIYRVK